MCMGKFDIPNVINRATKTAGATQDKATGKLTGVEEITVMVRDTMKIRPVPGITIIAPGRTLKKANYGGTMMIQEKGSATHPMENTKTEFVIFRGYLLKDPEIGAKSLIN